MARKEFTRKTKLARWLHAGGLENLRCEYCGEAIDQKKSPPEYDHYIEANDGGDNSFENCRIACRECHAKKTANYIKETRKAERIRDRANGALTKKGRGFPKRERRRPATSRVAKLYEFEKLK